MTSNNTDISNSILEKHYKDALEKTKSKSNRVIDSETKRKVTDLLKHIDKNKSVIGALVTSLLKKIISPEQDIRLHRVNFKGGYSARSIDTRVTTPFFIKYFTRYSNKESAFLTMATREKVEWNLIDGEQLKIRNKEFRTLFLTILDDIQKKPNISHIYLTEIFYQLINMTQNESNLFESISKMSIKSGTVNINLIVEILEVFFTIKNSSRLPVIAIWTIYQELIKSVKRYKGKILLPLKVHTSSDKKGYGDIEILDERGHPFEIIEIKHNIPIERNLVSSVFEKVKNTETSRYYILTTYKGCYSNTEEETYINKLILTVKSNNNIEIIVNGIIQSLKYYLRLLENYESFLMKYTTNLINDAKYSAEVTPQQVRIWHDILKKRWII